MYYYVQEGCLYLSVVDLNACHMRCSSKPQECEPKHVTGCPKEKICTENNKSNIGRQQFQEWTHTIPTLFPNKIICLNKTHQK